MTAVAQEAGAKALAALDKVLAERPHKDDVSLSETTKQCCIVRDDLIARFRASGSADDARRLEHLNSVLSVVAALHYPMGETPWDELVKAQGWLVGLLAEPV